MIRALERRPPDVSYKQLVDVYAADSAARDPEMLQATLLPHLVKRAQVQGSFADFKRRFDESTGGWLTGCGVCQALPSPGVQ